jgi:hypothetical protein
MCDVPSIAVFCSESTECLPGIASKFFYNCYYSSGSTYYRYDHTLLLLLLYSTHIYSYLNFINYRYNFYKLHKLLFFKLHILHVMYIT